MNTLVKKVVVLSAAIAVQWFSVDSQVSAQPCQSVETRQSYAYQPAAFGVGDQVVVSVDEAKLMKGTDALASVKKGQSFQVREIQGPWLGTEIERDGRTIKGWVWYNHATLADKPSTETADRAAAQPPVERRSFSYEPSEPRSFSYEPSYRSYPRYRTDSGRRKAAWEYPKTDARRYRP